jgi:UrcA family protein
VKTKSTARTISHALLSIIAVIAISIPLLASAATNQTGKSKTSILYSKQDLNNSTDQEILYAKLKDASRDMCGSSHLHRTGSVERSSENNECFEGTLTAAVERLNNPQVTAIHNTISH